MHRAALDELFAAFALRDESYVSHAGLSHTADEVRAAFVAFDRDGCAAASDRALRTPQPPPRANVSICVVCV